jgi:enamine deaminase RidA (YjgF/YER057c/UK114 family)
MHKKLAIAAVALALFAPSGGALAQAAPAIERTVGSATATISSSASLPPGSRIVFLSGSTASPLDPAAPDNFGDTRQQTLSILTKMKAQLETLGLGMGDVVKMTVFLVGVPENGGRMDSAAMNEVFRTFFGTAEQPNRRPARPSRSPRWAARHAGRDRGGRCQGSLDRAPAARSHPTRTRGTLA